MRIILLTFCLAASLIFTGCSGEKYGAGIDSSAPKATVKDVFLKKNLLGQKVTLEGNIVSQCQSNGCWFYLRDATGQIYIDLKTHNFTLPSMPNKNVAATGTVARSENTVLLVASGVEVK